MHPTEWGGGGTEEETRTVQRNANADTPTAVFGLARALHTTRLRDDW